MGDNLADPGPLPWTLVQGDGQRQGEIPALAVDGIDFAMQVTTS